MKRIIVYCLILIGFSLFAQEKHLLLSEIDSIRKKTLNREISFNEVKTYVDSFLVKAREQKKQILIGKAYYYLGLKAKELHKQLQYLDSAILYTGHLKDDKWFPMNVYLAKGNTLQAQRNYHSALDNYLLAELQIKSNGNTVYQYDIKYNIGFLKRILGDYDEAERLFKQSIPYKKNKNKRYWNNYMHTLFQLSSVYYESGQVEKCTAINREGIQIALDNDRKDLLHHFIVNEGINLSIKGDYQASVDSIEKGMKYLSKPDKVVSDFYLAKSYIGIGENAKALYYFKKIDSVFNSTNHLLPLLRESYEYLIENTKEKKDKEQQLYYTNQLLKLDSMIHTNYKYLTKTIKKKYDFPQLIAEREHLITALKKEKAQAVQQRNWAIEVGLLVCVLLLGGLLYYYTLKRKYKKRYETIIERSKTTIKEEIRVKDVKISPEALDIEEALVEEVLKQLELFEQEHQYITTQISLNDVAKIVNTNSKYLSKIINLHKGKNFTSYINDLRIDYLIDHIQHDPIYMKYTVKAIALEGGFSNPQAFYRAFQKKTGLKPTYFINKVREN